MRIGAVHEYFEDVVRKAIDNLIAMIGIQIVDDSPSGYYFKSKEACIDAEIK